MSAPHPGDYPWPEPALTGVLGVDGTVRPQSYDAAGRVPVLAVGSNASSTVLRRKLGPLLAAGLPVDRAVVVGLGVGHSAHLSAGGYVPAAPFRSPGATCAVAVAWPDPEQLEALDTTEPNYARVLLTGARCTLLDGSALEAAQLYDSRHGVLADGSGVLPLSSQAEVLGWLGARLPPGVPPGAESLRAAGLARPSGLG